MRGCGTIYISYIPPFKASLGSNGFEHCIKYGGCIHEWIFSMVNLVNEIFSDYLNVAIIYMLDQTRHVGWKKQTFNLFLQILHRFCGCLKSL
jgi:hypothetical protein